MRPALLTKEGINPPAAINPDLDAQVFESCVEINDVTGGHGAPISGRDYATRRNTCALGKKYVCRGQLC